MIEDAYINGLIVKGVAMKGLYKGRYIIAIYDKNDYLIEVACSPKELTRYSDENSARSNISKVLNGRSSKSIHLIDVMEKQDDIFAEEDEIFLDYVLETQVKTIKGKAKELGISERTYYRHQKLFNTNVSK